MCLLLQILGCATQLPRHSLYEVYVLQYILHTNKLPFLSAEQMMHALFCTSRPHQMLRNAASQNLAVLTQTVVMPISHLSSSSPQKGHQLYSSAVSGLFPQTMHLLCKLLPDPWLFDTSAFPAVASVQSVP